jgi:putative endopeptidase
VKTSLAFAVSLVAIAAAAPATAADRHACLDEGCATVSLIAQGAAGGAADASVPTPYGRWGFDIAGMDRSVEPGDDWFNYVNGTWAKNTQIPADRSSYGAFAVLRDLSEARLRKLLGTYRADDTANLDRAKVAALYGGFMDEAAAERADAAPLVARLTPIKAAANKDDVARLMGQAMGGFGASFFGPGVNDDAKQPDVYALYLRQSGLGLGDRDLYLDAKFKPQLDRYRQYVAQMLGMAGWPNAAAAADKVVAMEMRIAQAHWTRAQSRDRDKTYNIMTLAQLQAQAPGFPWATYWNAAGIAKAERAIVAQNTAFPKIAQVFADSDLDTLKAWQAFRTAVVMAPLLS